MDKIIAYCRLVCTDCPAYIATQANDGIALEQVAAQWRKEYNAPNLTVDDVPCDGCLSGPRKCSHCAECKIRACGIDRGVVNGAYCSNYACEKLENFFSLVPNAQVVLNEIIASL